MTYNDVRDIIEDVRKQTENLYAERRQNPPARKYSDDFVFDENQSVRWNREEVIRQNKAIDNARRAFERKVNRQSARVDEAIKQYLKDEFDFGDAVAAKVFEMAWEHGHPCEFDEVLIDAQSYGEFVKSILAAYEKERNV